MNSSLRSVIDEFEKRKLHELWRDYSEWAKQEAVNQPCPYDVPGSKSWTCCEEHRRVQKEYTELHARASSFEPSRCSPAWWAMIALVIGVKLSNDGDQSIVEYLKKEHSHLLEKHHKKHADPESVEERLHSGHFGCHCTEGGDSC